MSNADGFRQAQATLWGAAGIWAHDMFDELNAAYFGGEVPQRGIAWGLTPHGHSLGHTWGSGRITLHTLRPKAWYEVNRRRMPVPI